MSKIRCNFRGNQFEYNNNSKGIKILIVIKYQFQEIHYYHYHKVMERMATKQLGFKLNRVQDNKINTIKITKTTSQWLNNNKTSPIWWELMTKHFNQGRRESPLARQLINASNSKVMMIDLAWMISWINHIDIIWELPQQGCNLQGKVLA